MKTIDELHQEAMFWYDKGFFATQHGDNSTEPLACYRQALVLEQQAALLALAQPDAFEKAMLCKSVAALALLVEEYGTAEQFACHGLLGNQSGYFVWELRKLLQKALKNLQQQRKKEKMVSF